MRRLINIILILISINVFSQNSKQELLQEQLNIEKKIKETNLLLNKEREKKNSVLNQISLSDKNLTHHQSLIDVIQQSLNITNTQIKIVQNNILDIEGNIYNYELELENSREFLSNLLYQIYIWKNTYNETYFLISSNSLNQMFKRKHYLKQLTLYKVNQVQKIKKISKILHEEKEKLVYRKSELLDAINEKNNILLEKESLILSFKKEKEEYLKVVELLMKNEDFYRKKLIQDKEESQKIAEKIKKIIEEEIRKSEVNSINEGIPLTPEMLELSSSFELNKGKLPWPLEKATISSEFGIQKNKYLPGIETKNNGINFFTEPGQFARTVFKGKVSRIFLVGSQGKAVLINHGDFYTVYSGLKDVVVSVGEMLDSKQNIGTVITSENTKETELHFELWKGKETQNPLIWLYKAQ
tara:strand:+ start:50365 stop:51603 length:1239 start_codon:yes stop_codon:yes gene_type:complete